MTGGVAVLLGSIGANFGAGMTGGMAYLYDPDDSSADMMNMESLVTCKVTTPEWEAQLKGLLERHLEETRSRKAEGILQNWDLEKGNFVQVCPIEMLDKIAHPLGIEGEAIPAE
jgi:glutamate synthase (NADPH/NADH) large chain